MVQLAAITDALRQMRQDMTPPEIEVLQQVAVANPLWQMRQNTALP